MSRGRVRPARARTLHPRLPRYAISGFAIFALACLGPFATAARSADEKPNPVREVTKDLICPCSCGELLYPCACETAQSMRAFVDTELKAGKTPEQVETALVAKYGEVVRGAPRAEGFNLIVWIAPFLATAIGFVVATWLLLRWARRRAQDVAVQGTSPGSAADAVRELGALRARAEEELRRFKE